jgi:phage terminase small subunit
VHLFTPVNYGDNSAVSEDVLELTKREAIFVREYLVDLNATQAAIRTGYSTVSARSTGATLLAKPNVAAAVKAALEDRAERTQINADWVLKRLAAEADADIADLYDEGGALLPVNEWPLIWRQGLVSGVDIEELYENDAEGGKQNIGRVLKLRMSDRVKRLEMIGKHIAVNAFQDTIEIKGLDALAERLERAHARASVESEAV